MKNKKIKKYVLAICAVFFWLCIWQIISIRVDKQLLLPGPIAVFSKIGELIKTLSFWKIIFNSVKNILVGLVLGFLLGTLTAILTTNIKPVEVILKPLISVIKITPVASFILLLVLWMNQVKIPSFVSGLIVFPIVWANVSQGVSDTDPKLKELCKVFKFSFFKKFFYLYIPSVLPSVLSALMSSIGLAWKAGISAEIIALPHDTIGYEMFQAKNILLTSDVFAWTVVIIVLSVIVEKIIISLVAGLSNKFASRGDANA